MRRNMADNAKSTCDSERQSCLKEGVHEWINGSLSQSVQTAESEEDDNTYVCDVALNRSDCSTQLATRLSGPDVHIYNVDTLQKATSINAGLLTGLRFCPKSEHILWTCAADGKIKTWDLRASSFKAVQQWQDKSDGTPKPLLSFDVDKTASLVCAGSEQVREDVFLLFWDCRSTKLLGGYWESHSDDITQVSFNPTEGHLVASGSTDGLINIFDLQQSSEDDALQTTLNTDSSVASLRWLMKDESTHGLACITHTEDVQLWDPDEAIKTSSWNRSDIQSRLKDDLSVDYWTNVLPSFEAVVGNTQGEACMLSFTKESLLPRYMFKGSHTGSVRCAAWITKDEVLVTGGEDGQLCLWRCKPEQQLMQTQLVTKMASLKTSKPHRQKPYRQ